jgi:hypothetical protein
LGFGKPELVVAEKKGRGAFVFRVASCRVCIFGKGCERQSAKSSVCNAGGSASFRVSKVFTSLLSQGLVTTV